MCILLVSYLLNSDCSIIFLTNFDNATDYYFFFAVLLLLLALTLLLCSRAYLAQSMWPALSGSLTLAAINQSNHRTWPPFPAATPVLDTFCSYGSLPITVNYCIKHVKWQVFYSYYTTFKSVKYQQLIIKWRDTNLVKMAVYYLRFSMLPKNPWTSHLVYLW